MSGPVDVVKDADGEIVLHLNTRVGAAPFFRYVDGEWEAISLMYRPTKRYGAETNEVGVVKAEPEIEERQLRTWVEDNQEPFDLLDHDESPFADRDEYPWADAAEAAKHQEPKPCGEYHPLPCALDRACPVPVEYVAIGGEDESQAAVDKWQADGGEPE